DEIARDIAAHGKLTGGGAHGPADRSGDLRRSRRDNQAPLDLPWYIDLAGGHDRVSSDGTRDLDRATAEIEIVLDRFARLNAHRIARAELSGHRRASGEDRESDDSDDDCQGEAPSNQ